MKKLIFIFCFSLLLISSCTNTTYHKYNPVPEKGWGKLDTLKFEVPKTIKQPLDIKIDVRHDQRYPYRDLYLTVKENLTDSTQYRTETIHIKLTDKSGDWNGSGWSYVLQSSHDYKTIRYPQLSENSRIEIYPYMKDSLLVGIRDIGVSFNHTIGKPFQHLTSEK